MDRTAPPYPFVWVDDQGFTFLRRLLTLATALGLGFPVVSSTGPHVSYFMIGHHQLSLQHPFLPLLTQSTQVATDWHLLLDSNKYP